MHSSKNWSLYRWILNRSLGPTVGGARSGLWGNGICRQLFTELQCVHIWSPLSSKCDQHHGGIFNFDFTADGSILMAGCERNSLLIFDPSNGKLVGKRDNAHTDSVNCVRFLDSRLFASCSDDCTVRLWDLRNMSQSIRNMHGHTNMVKNIEFIADKGILVTSSFDGYVNMWDINSGAEGTDYSYQRLFYVNTLMRCRLSPDASKMVISTADGYLMVIHDLDIDNLRYDLRGFQPSEYRDVLTGESPPSSKVNDAFQPLFISPRNRVELILDFPWSDDDAGMIPSLEIHPQGWCAISRSSNISETCETTCIHDIQGVVTDVQMEKMTSVPSQRYSLRSRSEPILDGGVVPFVQHDVLLFLPYVSVADHSDRSSSASPNSPSDIERDSRSFLLTESANDSGENTGDLEGQDSSIHTSCVSDNDKQASPSQTEFTVCRPRRRLLQYINEPNLAAGRGFIKEIAFGAGGRIIASPFGFGVRLLAFDTECSELCDCVGRCKSSAPALQLHEVATNMCHGSVVMTARFSPDSSLLVTGSIDGKVCFHRPHW